MTDRLAALARVVIPGGALVACALLDPDHPAGWMVCPFRAVTGVPCPMCGMTRGIAALLRRRWADALAFHLFSPLVLAATVAWIIVELGQAARAWDARWLRNWAMRPAPWIVFLAVTTVYGALRWCGIIGVPRA